MNSRSGLLIAFEGLDQSGKQTQAEALRHHLAATNRQSRLLSFPDYRTAIGAEIAKALHGEREYDADVMQLLYVANRYECRTRIRQWLADDVVLLCDRYIASSVAYGEAHGLDPDWLTAIQRFLPRPDVTVLLDIAPETAVRRKATGRDRFERDLALLLRVRESYLRQAARADWIRLDGERPPEQVTADILRYLGSRLEPR